MYRPGVGIARRAAVRAAAGVEQVRVLRGVDAELVRPRGRSLETAVRALRARPDVLLAVPDQRRSTSVDPTGEAGWQEQWGHHNTGQLTGFDPPLAGRPDMDVDGLEALAITPGSSSVVVAVIDDGVDFSHPDLFGRRWINPGESGMDGSGRDKRSNSLDDDGNGFTDDTYGWDFCNGDRTVHDRNEDGHGTGVAGTIAASLNGEGTVGIAPSTRIMALKFLADPEDDPYGLCGWDSQAIEAIAYAKRKGVRIINASWGSPDVSPALENAIATSGALFVTAAGNEAWNIDRAPVYPAAFDAPNILTVGAVNSRGGLSPFSNYGSTAVDIAAPGEQILVPCPAEGTYEAGWCWVDGTSFASPYAAGTAALVAAVSPSLLSSPTALRSRVITSGVPLASLAGKVASGKLLNARRALDFVVPTLSAVRRIQPAEGSTLGSTWTPARISWPTMRDDTAVGSYRLEQRRNGGAWETVVNATTAAYRNVNVALSGTYEYRVTPRDAAGNLGSAGQALAISPTRHEESSGSVTWAGTWRTASSSAASGGGTRYATGWGAAATLAFSGRAASVVAPVGPAGSSVKVYVDGAYVKTVSLYSATAAARKTIFATSWTTPGDHTVKVVNLPVAGRYRAEIDAFVVLR
jgi:subtilisin family serine protease